MFILASMAVLFSTTASAQVETTDISCFHCHSREVNEFRESVHFNKNLCSDCHGGDINITGSVVSVNVMHTNFTGKPSSITIANFCTKCHEYSTNLYMNSIHWEKLKEGISAASCTDCHGVHNILSSKDIKSPTFAENIVETCANCHINQTLTYKKSYHYKSYMSGGKLLATCSDCHENHDTRTQSDPKSAINPANLPSTCGQDGCHAGASNVFVSGGNIHEDKSVYLLSIDAKSLVTYFYIIMILFEFSFTFGLIFLGIASKFDLKRRH